MTAVDWSTLTPREAFEALRTAPRVAGPWVTVRGEWVRLDARRGVVALIKGGDLCGWSTYGVDWGLHKTLEAAKAAADRALREQGWLLVGEVKL